MIRIFLGYDHREVVAYHVACHSIHVRSSQPVEIAGDAFSAGGHLYANGITCNPLIFFSPVFSAIPLRL